MAAEITGSGSGTSSGVRKVTFILSWKTANPGSGDIFAGSSRGDGASGKLSFESGLDWTNDKVTFQHDLNTEYLDLSILDVAGEINGVNQYVDIGASAESVIKYISANKTQISFNPTSADNGDIYKITFIG